MLTANTAIVIQSQTNSHVLILLIRSVNANLIQTSKNDAGNNFICKLYQVPVELQVKDPRNTQLRSCGTRQLAH